MYRPSELTDGSEPHDHICSEDQTCGGCMDDVGGSGRAVVYPGWWYWVGTREVLYRVLTRARSRVHLALN